MKYVLKIATAPAVEPVTTEEAKTHLRVTTSADDTYIGTLIKVARQQCESILNRALITQTWDMVMDAFPTSTTIKIPLPPLQSITSVQYVPVSTGVAATFASSNYLVDTYSEPGRVKLVDGASWPSNVLVVAAGVRIRFIAGYGLAVSVPEWAKQAILLYVGDLYENREDTVIAQGVTTTPLPNGAKNLLWPNRLEVV